MTTPALPLVMTTVGLSRFTAAQAEENVDLTIAWVGLTNAAFVVAPSLTALPGEFRRVATIAGESVGDNVIHMTVRDDAALTYQVRGFGLFLADGTLFAVYGQADPIGEKSSSATLLLAIDIAFPTSAIGNIVFGDTNFLNPPATSETKGVVELATIDEAEAGDVARVTSGAVVKAMLASLAGSVSAALAGLMSRTIYGSGLVTGGGDLTASRTLTVESATAAETRAGVVGNKAVTPDGLRGAGAAYVAEQSVAGDSGYRVWSDGLKECWGSVYVPANATVVVPLPVPHTQNCVPTGTCSINQDEASIGALGANAGGFSVRSRNPLATTFYWHTKGV